MSFEVLQGWWTDAGTFESLHRASIRLARPAAAP
jgi:dTDP-glucose pyrophosphorylase